ncbi:hypothetical protein [Staphylococcus ureilyticus]
MNAEQTKAARNLEITSDGLVTPDEKTVDALVQTLETRKRRKRGK